MAVKGKLDWLKRSTVRKEQNFTGWDHVYVDIGLDLAQTRSNTIDKNGLMQSIVGRGRDIQCIFDIQCIRNSLYTLFNTHRGSRVLVPEYGTTLYTWIGQSITDLHCLQIGTMLKADIEKWEPRVKVTNISVVPVHDNSEISISVYVEIPELSRQAIMKYLFNTTNGNLEPLVEEAI